MVYQTAQKQIGFTVRMQPPYPLVSLITVHYDHLSDTIEFLESARRRRDGFS